MMTTGAAFLHPSAVASAARTRAFATATGAVRTPRPSPSSSVAIFRATASASTKPPALDDRAVHYHHLLQCRTYPPSSLHSHRTTFQASEKRHYTTAPDEARTETKTWAPQASCGVIDYPMALPTTPSSSIMSSRETAAVRSTTILASSIPVLPVYSYVEMPPSLPSSPFVTFVSTDDDDDPETTLNRVVHSNDSGPADALDMSSTLKKRRAKMNKHKLKKRRKLLRLKSK